MGYTVEIESGAMREIRAVPAQDRRRITAKIVSLAQDPRPPGCTKLAGYPNLWRIRSGDYRIIYKIKNDRLIVVVVRVGHRRDVYRGI